MDELRALLEQAFADAGLTVPDDVGTMSGETLDNLVPDKRLRGKCKSALVRYKRAAGIDEHAAPAPAPAPEPEPVVETPVAEAAPEPVAIAPEPEPEEVVEVGPSAPMSAELAAKFADVEAAFAAASITVPADPVAFDLESLDAQLDDKQLRAKIKSAMVKFRRAAQAEGWTPAQAVSAKPKPKPATVAAPPVAVVAPPSIEAEPEPETEEPEEIVEAAPMSAELAAKFADVESAFTAAGATLPADPLAFDLESLDEHVEDRQARGKIKSAVVKFRRAAAAEGWQPAQARARAPRAAKPVAAAAAPTAQPSAAPASDVPLLPEGPAGTLWLLKGGAWTALGTAAVVPSHTDELCAQHGSTGRITNILVLDGKFEVPEDLYNTWCWLAHEGHVWRAYYISHVGDVRRGTRTGSLKVDASFDFAAWAEHYKAMRRTERPTADDLRRVRFGGGYEASRSMFAQRGGRMV